MINRQYRTCTNILIEVVSLVIEALSWIELKRINEPMAFSKTIEQLNIIDEKVMHQAYRLIVETTRRRNAIDFILKGVLEDNKVEDLKLGVRNLLRLYVFELKYGKKRYDEALQIVELGRKILGRKALSKVEEVFDILPGFEINYFDLSKVEKIALETFHPVWFVEYCQKLLRTNAIKFLKTSELPEYVRINSLKIDKLDVPWGNFSSISGLSGIYKADSLEKTLSRTKEYKKGFFSIQDKASFLVGLVAAPEAGMTVLDVCAAPGGKTGHLAELMGNVGHIYSVDFNERRTNIWKKEMKRLGVKITTPIISDARKDLPDVEADIVLVDPPCTGTGTFIRMPSGKWRIQRNSFKRMRAVQEQILKRSAERVLHGGSLVYSTCSISIEENEMVIKRFLDRNRDFKLVKQSPRIGVSGFEGQYLAQRLYPNLHECNGFYIAKMVRE